MAALDLFLGDGIGMDSTATRGTAYGAYNAVVEAEDYRTGLTERSRQESALVGERAGAKARAFAACWDFARDYASKA